MSITRKSLILISVILILDQFMKIWIKTSLMLGEEIHVFGNWFILHFTENNGMAFGIDIPGEFGKISLSLFRIAAVVGIAFFIRHLIRNKAHHGLVISTSLILAGAIGNIIDSAFYGVIFTDSWGRVAEIFPENGGYASFLHGRVVDMLYFPIIKGSWPDWFPFWGGQTFIFFRPVFNIADSSITTGVIIILIFQKRFFRISEKVQTEDTDAIHSSGSSEESIEQ
ncbi:MAG: peptidase A8 [Bacteroides sp. SM23_62_1]|nr:MAG: peptidase A8 [Bacteroides sp. SM23_62_1]